MEYSVPFQYMYTMYSVAWKQLDKDFPHLGDFALYIMGFSAREKVK